MVGNFTLPPMGFGPGSQPLAEDDTLEYMSMPQDMRTYAPHTPDVNDPAKVAVGMAMLAEIAAACGRVAKGGAAERFDLSGLDKSNRALIADVMAEGEVSVKIHGVPAIAVQESVFAGVWMLSGVGTDVIEVATMPTVAFDRAFNARKPATGAATPKIAGIANAPSIITELFDKSANFDPAAEVHVVNLSLLPHTEPDLVWLDQALGEGAVTILSRGYGNCRVTATGLAHVWRVQFFNSMDTLILDTFEVTAMPEVAIAADEDLRDSEARLLDVLETIR